MRRRGAHARNALHWPRQWHNPLRWWTVVKICCNWSSPETQLADVTNFVIRLTVALVWVYSMHRSWNLIDAVGLCLHENSARRSAVGKVGSQKSRLAFGLREEWRMFNRSLFDTFFSLMMGLSAAALTVDGNILQASHREIELFTYWSAA